MTKHPDLHAIFDQVVECHTAGLPQNESVIWTYLKPADIAQEMAQKGHAVSRYIVKQLLESKSYKTRSMLKVNELKEVEQRNEQFEKIAHLRKVFAEQGQPILSIDTKKKEMLGMFQRKGQSYTQQSIETYDHDFLSFSQGQVVPHGIYDVLDNTGYISLGTNKETSEFVCDNISHYWKEEFQFKYQDSHTMLLLCDGGGANSCLHYIFKYDLVKMANQLKMNILVAHYPAYCSKYNPIEHRLFSQITHTWDGKPLINIEFVKELTKRTKTKTGLEVKVRINDKTYLTKRQAPQEFKDNIHQYCIFDDKIPQWNYLIKFQDF